MPSLFHLSVFALVLSALAACTDPPPRGTASQGVATPAASDRSLNAPYYTGSDPDFQRRGGSSGRP